MKFRLSFVRPAPIYRLLNFLGGLVHPTSMTTLRWAGQIRITSILQIRKQESLTCRVAP